jgi:hypothetical protein
MLFHICSITQKETPIKQQNVFSRPGIFVRIAGIVGAIAGGQPDGWTGEGCRRRGTLPARRPPAGLFMYRQHANTQKMFEKCLTVCQIGAIIDV